MNKSFKHDTPVQSKYPPTKYQHILEHKDITELGLLVH